jgi:hypothetical protein
MSAFSDIVDTAAELQLRTAPSTALVMSIERADALDAILSLTESSTRPHLEGTLSLDLVQKLEILWPDTTSRQALCSLGDQQAQQLVDLLQQVRLFIIFRLIRP